MVNEYALLQFIINAIRNTSERVAAICIRISDREAARVYSVHQLRVSLFSFLFFFLNYTRSPCGNPRPHDFSTRFFATLSYKRVSFRAFFSEISRISLVAKTSPAQLIYIYI